MLPQPLHPAIVHFPVVLAAILPLAVAWGLFRTRREVGILGAWVPALAIGALLVVTATIALETGEEQEDLVEAVVAEEAIHQHEESAELLQRAAIAVLVLMAVGLLPALPERGARVARLLTLAASVVLLPLVWRAGQTGGELVYRHGAAAVYVDSPVTSTHRDTFGDEHEDEHEDDD